MSSDAVYNIDNLSKEEIISLFEDLRVHQYEIESQNEELRRLQYELSFSKQETESQRIKFFELYKYSPTAFFTFDDDFRIIDVNVKTIELLKSDRTKIIGKSFHKFVLSEYQNIFHSFCFDLLNTKDNHHCEIKIINFNDEILDVKLIGRNFSDLGDNSISSFAQVYDISLEKRYFKEKLDNLEHNYQSFFENLPIGIYRTKVDGTFLNANSAFLKILGYSNLDELKNDLENNRNSINYFSRIEFRRLLNNCPNYELNGYEFEFIRIDGKRCFLRENSRLIFDELGKPLCYEGTIEDITQIKFTEKTLEAQQKFITSVIESLPNYVYVYDLQLGKIIFANSICESMLGYSKDELLSMKKNESMNLIHPDDINNINDSFLKISNEDSIKIFKSEYRIKTKSGNYIWVSESSTPLLIDKNGKIITIIGTFFDITDRKNAEINLEKLIKQKDKFFSILAHDMRGPFMGFIGLSEILSKDYNELSLTEIVEIASSLFQSANRILRLLENLLEWSKIQQEEYVISLENRVLSDEVAECIEIIEANSKSKQITINSSIDKSIVVHTDSNIIRTITRNLLSNAIKFTNENGIINISSSENGGFITLIIEDNGIGMEKKILDNVFDMSVKTSTIGTKNEQGSGLGLILCKELSQKNGGDLIIESEVGIGTKATLFIKKELKITIVK